MQYTVRRVHTLIIIEVGSCITLCLNNLEAESKVNSRTDRVIATGLQIYLVLILLRGYPRIIYWSNQISICHLITLQLFVLSAPLFCIL